MLQKHQQYSAIKPTNNHGLILLDFAHYEIELMIWSNQKEADFELMAINDDD